MKSQYTADSLPRDYAVEAGLISSLDGRFRHQPESARRKGVKPAGLFVHPRLKPMVINLPANRARQARNIKPRDMANSGSSERGIFEGLFGILTERRHHAVSGNDDPPS